MRIGIIGFEMTWKKGLEKLWNILSVPIWVPIWEHAAWQRILEAKEGKKGLFDAGLTDDPNWTCYIFDMLRM